MSAESPRIYTLEQVKSFPLKDEQYIITRLVGGEDGRKRELRVWGVSSVIHRDRNGTIVYVEPGSTRILSDEPAAQSEIVK